MDRLVAERRKREKELDLLRTSEPGIMSQVSEHGRERDSLHGYCVMLGGGYVTGIFVINIPLVPFHLT